MALWLFLLALAPVNESELRQYKCLDGSRFSLRLSRQLAVVTFADGEYRLARRSSGIAVKYESRKATLYLDGEFAAFVADDRPLPGCKLDRPGERG